MGAFDDLKCDAEIMRETNADAFNYNIEGILTNGSKNVTVQSAGRIKTGFALSGSGIPASTVIESITDNSTIVISIAATITGTVLLTIELYTDAELQALKFTSSKNDLKKDIRDSFKMKDTTDNDATIDLIVTDYEVKLKTALLYIQLFYYYFEKQQGEDSLEFDRMKYYEKMYKSEKSQFVNMKIDTFETSRAVEFYR